MMSDVFDPRIARMLHAEADGLPLLVSGAMVEDRLARSRTSLFAALGAIGLAAIVLAFIAVASLPGALNRGGSASSPSTPVVLPRGTFVTDLPLGRQCIAVIVEEPGATSFPVQWWDAGRSDDCTTRTSDIVSAQGNLGGDGTISYTVWLIPSGTATVEFEVQKIDSDGISALGRDAVGSEQGIHFSLRSEVAPTFAPID